MLRELLSKLLGRTKQPATSTTPTDYAGNRETERVGNLSDEDRAWEADRSQRNRDTETRAANDPQ